jgi:hypothetical protein
MRATITRNFGPLDGIKLTDKALMREVGLLARERIYRRTVSGQATGGSPFAPYSAGYAALKKKELGAGKVNLQVSGAMLNAIQITRVDDTEVELGFSG